MAHAVETFLKLRPRLCELREQEDGWIIASLNYDEKDSRVLSILIELHNDGVIAEIRHGAELVFPSEIGKSGLLELHIDTGKLPGYFELYDSLIKTHPDACPSELFVWEKNTTFQAGYVAACELLQFLKSKAEVWDATEQRFYLVDQQAIEIPLRSYAANQTVELPLVLSSLTRFLDSKHLDADARWAFFRKASLRFLRDIPPRERLGILMQNLRNLLGRAQQDYSLYLERFSFEDVLKNFDEKRLNFVSDLNQILASIQTSLIAVPIGFFLIAEKFKSAGIWIGQNIILAIGGFVFFALLFVLSLNQGKTLHGIQFALMDFETEQRKKVTDRTERLQALLATTWSQYRRVRLLLWIVRIILCLFMSIVVTTFFWCSLPALQRWLPYSK